MKKSTKKKVIAILDDIIEKCGGPGSGVPGPCPTGEGGSGGGDKAKSAKAAMKAMPAGSVRDGNKVKWSKSGGHSGKNAIIKTRDKMLALGFEKVQGGSSGSAVIHHDNVYKHPHGHTFGTTSSYGSSASSNSFSMELVLAGD